MTPWHLRQLAKKKAHELLDYLGDKAFAAFFPGFKPDPDEAVVEPVERERDSEPPPDAPLLSPEAEAMLAGHRVNGQRIQYPPPTDLEGSAAERLRRLRLR